MTRVCQITGDFLTIRTGANLAIVTLVALMTILVTFKPDSVGADRILVAELATNLNRVSILVVWISCDLKLNMLHLLMYENKTIFLFNLFHFI